MTWSVWQRWRGMFSASSSAELAERGRDRVEGQVHRQDPADLGLGQVQHGHDCTDSRSVRSNQQLAILSAVRCQLTSLAASPSWRARPRSRSRLVANDIRTNPSAPNATPGTRFTWACSSSAVQNASESVTGLPPNVLPKYADTSKKA